MSDILLVGAGNMGREYSKVLKTQKINHVVICRSEESAKIFEKDTEIRAFSGGVGKAYDKIGVFPENAIVAVNVECLAETTMELLKRGVKRVLLEKPGGLDKAEIQKLYNFAKEKQAEVYVAYNRRFYASVDKALEFINEDGGVCSFSFEFTEWSDQIIANTHHPIEVMENWLLANSSHVIDLAFYLGGYPTNMHSYVKGNLSWHRRAARYTGAGVTDKGATFSYQADWDAPGRWGVEILTKNYRLYLRPIEKLSVQKRGSVAIDAIDLDDHLDVEFKPGLYNQVKAFIQGDGAERLLTLEGQLKDVEIYEKIEKLN